MISCKSPSSVCVESHFGQAWKNRTLCPIKTLNLTKVAVQNKKHKRVKPLGWTWAFNSPCLDIRLDWLRWQSFFELPPPPRVPSSAACNSMCSSFHVLARTVTRQIYFIRIKWRILLFKKSSHGPQFVQSHIRPFALLCCCPVNRAQAVQHKLGFSCWGRKRGLKQQINKAPASRNWRLHWKMLQFL